VSDELLEEYQEVLLDLYEMMESTMDEFVSANEYQVMQTILTQLVQATNQEEQESNVISLSLDTVSDVVLYVWDCQEADIPIQWAAIRHIVALASKTEDDEDDGTPIRTGTDESCPKIPEQECLFAAFASETDDDDGTPTAVGVTSSSRTDESFTKSSEQESLVLKKEGNNEAAIRSLQSFIAVECDLEHQQVSAEKRRRVKTTFSKAA
jgi:hypothetical protein